jgi:bacterioferritin-associated ferredoxin
MIDVLGERTETTRSLEDGKKAMIICQCNGVSDRAIRKAVREGASNRNDVVRACTAGKACGGCVPAIDEIIDAEQERIERSGLTVLKLVTG